MLQTVAGTFSNPPVQEVTAGLIVTPDLFWGPPSVILLLNTAVREVLSLCEVSVQTPGLG